MTEKRQIDDAWFSVHCDGMTLVDAYYIPDEDVEEYIKDRERLAQKVMVIFAEHAFEVTRDFAGSQDGEAIIGRDEEGEITHFIHLDPGEIKGMKEAEEAGELEHYLLNME